ncbi:WD40 repeat-like protein [Suillus weaverae]|nr:WD40 repeat-like protein [Suillus weaverae]
MTETKHSAIRITTASQTFEGHEESILGAAVFPDRRRMVTASFDETLRLWDLEDGVVLKIMEGHRFGVGSVAVSRDGQFIVSGDFGGELVAWNRDGEPLTKPIKVHSEGIRSLDFPPDNTLLASGSLDTTVELWNTKTWKVQGNPINCGARIACVRYSPSGELLAIATNENIQIWNPGKRECIAKFQGHCNGAWNCSLAWTPDGTRLLSSGGNRDPTLREWDTSTWMQVGEPGKGHTGNVWMIAMNPTGTLLASACGDYEVRLWQLSDRRTIAIFQHTSSVYCATFSTDGNHILSGGDNTISKWAVPSLAREDIPKDQALYDALREDTLCNDALLDAEKVIELNPSSYFGYQLKYTALHGAHRYDEAIEAFKTMLSKLENAPDMETTKLRQQYVNPSEAERAIQETIEAQLDDAPHRLLNTFTGRLCDREVQIDAFKRSTEYKELLSSILVHVDLRMERIKDVVETYFRYVMLSHRWGGKEPLLHNIQGKVVYDLDPVGGIAKLQSFCATARDMGYRWTWIDTCCIDQTNNVEVQQSVNSMFIWYRHSALTIIYLSDVPPSSQPGALASSVWNTRGWTVQEFLAPKFVLFYQKDWSLYLDDRSPNHKDSLAIMQEMGDATGIDAQALVAFRPGMRDAREKLQWVSARVTKWQEDIAYSLFGIFGVNLPIIYGEKKQKALGRLLQEVVAQSGDISALDWVGESSEFNSCLPANITSYTAPPCTLPSLSEDEIQTSVSLLRNTEAMESASRLYTLLDHMSAPRFANCRLHLPCIAFRVTAVKRSRAQDQEIYEVKAGGLHDLLITTEDKLIQFSSPRPTMQTFFLVRPWNRYLLDLPDFAEPSGLAELPDVADDTQSEEDYWSAPGSPLQDSPDGFPVAQESADSELSDRALRLTARLTQPFGAFLLAQQRGGEYKRIASDHDIIAQVKDLSSILDMVKTLEIL